MQLWRQAAPRTRGNQLNYQTVAQLAVANIVWFSKYAKHFFNFLIKIAACLPNKLSKPDQSPD